mgnify:FL=1
MLLPSCTSRSFSVSPPGLLWHLILGHNDDACCLLPDFLFSRCFRSSQKLFVMCFVATVFMVMVLLFLTFGAMERFIYNVTLFFFMHNVLQIYQTRDQRAHWSRFVLMVIVWSRSELMALVLLKTRFEIMHRCRCASLIYVLMSEVFIC